MKFWCIALLLVAVRVHATEALAIHNVAMLTWLEDEAGNCVGGINSVDEPLPNFVYAATPTLFARGSSDDANKAPRPHSDVTMRIERSAVYFYPEEGWSRSVDVRASVHQGWVDDYFPDARAANHSFHKEPFEDLLVGTGGSVEWRDVHLSTTDERRSTLNQSWSESREVEAATVDVKGEHEKFLFYRGVAHNAAPLKVVCAGPELIMTGRSDPNIDIHQLWLAEIRRNGSVAVRELRRFNDETAFVVRTAAQFAAEDFGGEKIDLLRDALRAALMKHGLFEDEAEALLAACSDSCFEEPGMRLFFVNAGQTWERDLRIDVENANGPSIRPRVTNVTLGRIELITPSERTSLAQLASHRAFAAAGQREAKPDDVSDAEWDSKYRDYERLGRFRNALLLDEQVRRPTEILNAFIQRFRLEGYTPARPWAKNTR